MRLRELYRYDYIPDNSLYNSAEWYVGIAYKLKKVLNVMYGEREVIVQENVRGGVVDMDYVVDYVRDAIDVVFLIHNNGYRRIWKALTAEYNPIWNVESKETLTYSKKNVGNEGIEESVEGSRNSERTDTENGKDTESNTGTVKVEGVNKGTVKNEGEGSGENVESLTPFNSSDLLVSEKNENSMTDKSTRTDDLSSEEVRTDDLSSTKNREGSLKSVESGSDKNSRDVLKDSNYNEDYEEIRIRGGNMGVTKSSELVQSEIDLRVANSFLDIVCVDVINAICYGC